MENVTLVEGSLNNLVFTTLGYFEVAKLEDSFEGEPVVHLEGIFASLEALEHCIVKALAGSPVILRSLTLDAFDQTYWVLQEIERGTDSESPLEARIRLTIRQVKVKPKAETKSIYVASSWRNTMQPAVVIMLRTAGFEVYDFKDANGFHWEEIAEDYEQWTEEEHIAALTHPAAERGFKQDMDAMREADTFVLVLPAGRSACLELGWAVGQGKKTVILMEQDMRPDLMMKMVDHMVPDVVELLGVLGIED